MFHIRATGQWPPGWDQDSKWEGELPNASNSHRSFTLWNGASTWPCILKLAPDILFTKSLNLAAIDMKLVAVNWNSIFGHSIWVKGPGKKWNKPLGLGKLCPCDQWGSLSDIGMPPTWVKGIHLPPGTTKLGNLRDGHDLSQFPLSNQILRILLLCV